MVYTHQAFDVQFVDEELIQRERMKEVNKAAYTTFIRSLLQVAESYTEKDIVQDVPHEAGDRVSMRTYYRDALVAVSTYQKQRKGVPVMVAHYIR